MADKTAEQRLEKFRGFLAVLARQQCRDRYRGKVDLSGVVQQTLLEGYQAGSKLEDLDDAQRAAWLRRALANNLADEFRKLATGKRDAAREFSLQASMEQSSDRLERLMPADLATPSKAAQQAELLLEVVAALETLPETQRLAIELHHVQGLSLPEVAAAMNTTKPAVAGLLHRGLKKLRESLGAG